MGKRFVLPVVLMLIVPIVSMGAAVKAPQGAAKLPISNATSLPTVSGDYQPTGVPGSWRLVFDDEFDGSGLDTSKWQPNWLGGKDTDITKPVNSYEKACYDPKQVSVANSSLQLAAVARTCLASNGTTYNYASGIVNSYGRFEFNYGFMEAKVYLNGSTQIDNWPAFWADGTGKWPTTGEIDVMEGLGGTAAYHYHYGHGNGKSIGKSVPLNPVAGWHIFAADWESGVINFYYDGKPVGQVTSGVVNNNMYLILDYALSDSISPPIKVPSTMQVDYVRVWQKQ